MKMNNKMTLCCLAAAGLGACTTTKRDDHSYTYIYQHNPSPQRQVLETVTTHSTRTRRYSAPEDSQLPSDDPQQPQADESNASDLRSDPLPPLPRRNPYLGAVVPTPDVYFREPARPAVPQYVIPAPVSYYRPSPVVYYNQPVASRCTVRAPAASYSAHFALNSVRPAGGISGGASSGSYSPPDSFGPHYAVPHGR